MDDPRETPRQIGLLYSWQINEYILCVHVIGLSLMGVAVVVLWALKLIFLGRGPGRWAAGVMDRARARRAETGNWFGQPPAYAWHYRQVMRFQALYLLFVVCTCGVGLVIGAPFYIYWFIQARPLAEQGGWPRLPVVGRWQPEPPMERLAP